MFFSPLVEVLLLAGVRQAEVAAKIATNQGSTDQIHQ